MGVRCGYCGDNHDKPDDVETCTMRRLLNRRPKLHPVNAAAWKVHAANARRREEAEKEAPRDVERNLAGIQRARSALRRQPA
jgi:hypothetical protein